jgi:hypothetical protein
MAGLEVAGDLDREDAELALVVELDRGVPGRTRGLLVGGEERVLERADDRVLLDPLLALEASDVLDDLLGHCSLLAFVDQVAPDDLVVRDLD